MLDDWICSFYLLYGIQTTFMWSDLWLKTDKPWWPFCGLNKYKSNVFWNVEITRGSRELMCSDWLAVGNVKGVGNVRRLQAALKKVDSQVMETPLTWTLFCFTFGILCIIFMHCTFCVKLYLCHVLCVQHVCVSLST